MLGLDRTGRMSLLTGQDRTHIFARQVLPDRTESGLIFFNILTYYVQVINSQKIRSLDTNLVSKLFRPNEKKNEKKIEKKIDSFFLILIVFKKSGVMEGKRPVSGQSGF